MSSKKFILSDGSRVNSKGFRVLLAGGNFERFNQNPVMLYGHDDINVIGRWENIRVENNKLTATPVFDGKDAFAAEIERKVNEGFLKGASIGMIPIKFEYENENYVLTQWELLEASIVPIPSDAGAVVLFNENHEKLEFEKLQLNAGHLFINKKSKAMEKTGIILSQATITSLGLQGDPTPKEVELAVSEKDKEIARLNLELANQKKLGVQTYLNNAAKAGKITEAEKTHFSKLAETDFDSVKQLIDGRAEKPGASLSEMVQKSGALTARADWTYLQWMKEDPAGLAKLKLENPKEFERLQQTFKN